ncbi:MAG: hypothetical protein HFJ40_03540 [Clostridia bacterium]|nr:hypothetical protein [Clostridia bacterium]
MEQVINKKVNELSKTGELVQIILIILGALLVPAVLPQLLQVIFGKTSAIASNSQIIVGSIVNTALIITGVNVKGWRKLILIATLPSLSAIGSGYIFGSLTKATIFMIPGIWFGNFSLIILMKELYANREMNYIISAIIAIVVKVSIIFGVLNIWMAISVLPNQGAIATTLKNTMGLTQLITASIGACISMLIIKLVFNRNTEKRS